MSPSSPSDAAGRWAVVWEAPDGPVTEGGLARRRHIVAALAAAGARVIRLPRRRAHRLARMACLPLDLAALVRAAVDSGAPNLLVFYPDFPLLIPRSIPRLAAATVGLLLLRAVLGASGRRLVVDVGDWPRPQSATLHVPLGLPAPLVAAFERLLVALADELVFPSSVLARHVASELGRPGLTWRLLPNGAPAELWPAGEAPDAPSSTTHPEFRMDPSGVPCGTAAGPPPPPAPGHLRFIYAGDLSLEQDRGVARLIERFDALAGCPVELVLAGEGGAWIDRSPHASTLLHTGPLPEPELVAWTRTAHVGLVPYPPTGYYTLVMPTKLALYAACGLAVVTTPLDEAARIVRGHDLGLVVPFEELPGIFERTAELWPLVQRRRTLPPPPVTWPALVEAALLSPAAHSSASASPAEEGGGSGGPRPPGGVRGGASPL